MDKQSDCKVTRFRRGTLHLIDQLNFACKAGVAAKVPASTAIAMPASRNAIHRSNDVPRNALLTCVLPLCRSKKPHSVRALRPSCG